LGAYASALAAEDLTFAAAGDHALLEGAEQESGIVLLRNPLTRQDAHIDKHRLGRISANQHRISAI
jgi:hypothetical protein